MTGGYKVIDQPSAPATTPSRAEGRSPFSPSTPLSPPFSPGPSFQSDDASPLGSFRSPLDSDDSSSITSASQLPNQTKFVVPDSWPPAIMHCISQHTDEDERKHLTTSVRNEIVRVLSVQMFCYAPKPRKEFCTHVAQMLVKKYPFMKDAGERVSGYVS